MKNLAKIFALTALAAAAALSMTAMSLTGQPTDDNSGGNSDPLNGTWTYRTDFSSTLVVKLDNGAFEAGDRDGVDYRPTAKGTYTTSGSEMTMTITDVSGYLAGERYDIDDPKEWYSIDELLQAAAKLWEIVADNAVLQCTYSLDGNTLTLTTDWEILTYTRE